MKGTRMDEYINKKQFEQFKRLVEQNIDLIVQNRIKDDIYVKQLIIESRKLIRQNWDLRQRIDENKKRIQKLQNRIKKQ